MRHIRTVSRARVREAQTATEILSLIGAILSIFTTLSGVIPPFIGVK